MHRFENQHLLPGLCVMGLNNEVLYEARIVSVSWSVRRVHTPIEICYIGGGTHQVSIDALRSMEEVAAMRMYYQAWLFAFIVHLLPHKGDINELDGATIEEGMVVMAEQSNNAIVTPAMLCITSLPMLIA